MKEKEFIKGQWYEINTKYFKKYDFCFKYDYTKGDRYYYTELITHRKYEEKLDFQCWDINDCRLLEISEIEKYLPEGHKDLIPKEELLTIIL